MTARQDHRKDASRATRAARLPMRTSYLAAWLLLVLAVLTWALLSFVALSGVRLQWLAGSLVGIVGIGFGAALAIRHRALKRFEMEIVEGDERPS